MRKFLSLFFMVGLLIVIVLSACSGENVDSDADTDDAIENDESEDTKKDGEKYKIGILAPAVTHGWVAAVAYHAENRVKELSDEIEYQIQTSSDASEMTSQLDDLMTWGAEAIVAFPQWEGMETSIQTALDNGIEVVNFDIEIDVDGVYRVAGDNEDMGIQGAHYIVDKIGTEGNVVVLEVPTAGSVSELRKKGFEDTIAEIAPDLTIQTYATEFTREAGLKDFSDILTANSQIDAVYSLDDETSVGVLQAIQEAGRDDIKVVTGGGGMQEYFNMMPQNEDIWIQSALYSPAMVKDAVDVALKVLKGEDVDEQIIIPTTIVDRDNYEEFIDTDSPY
ncbi:ABC transporter substrate-binding protein [Pseudogracilibacillus sp. SE30717A]|uniref:ABC transporter substrate-binding protein n=1 Tax=Pseudogracilibacillus sp. SE30717A TaxID=3098293 RepID=UPI00300E496E